MRKLGKEFIDKKGNITYRCGRSTVTKQKVVYEQFHNVELTSNDIVIFLNGNKRDFSKDNLFLISRAEDLWIKRHYKLSNNPEENLIIILTVRLKIKRIELAKKYSLVNDEGLIITDRIESREKYESKPEVKAHKREKVREYMRKRRADPAFKAKEAEYRQSAERKERHNQWKKDRRKNDPEYAEKDRIYQRKMYELHREERLQKMREKRLDPAFREKEREYRRKRWAEKHV